MNPLDVDANNLIKVLSSELKKTIKKPEFVDYVKASCHNERPPEQKDFWWIRCAAILRHVYKQGSVGTQRLRVHFGGSKNRGRKPSKFKKGSGNIIRKILQQRRVFVRLICVRVESPMRSDKNRSVQLSGNQICDDLHLPAQPSVGIFNCVLPRFGAVHNHFGVLNRLGRYLT